MNLINKILSKFSAIEILTVAISLLISFSLLLVGITYSPPIPERAAVFVYPNTKAYNTNGTEIGIFNTDFAVLYEQHGEETNNKVRDILDEFLVPYHKLFDRHQNYFAVDPIDPLHPTAEEKATLPLLKNLKYINEHFGEEIEIEKPLYELLSFGYDYTVNTPNGAFNMFIGELYDYWQPFVKGEMLPEEDPLYDNVEKAELTRLHSFIPQTESEISDTLMLWEDDNKYFVKLNGFNGAAVGDMSISVGALGKGYMADVLKKELTSKSLVDGYINGGQSTITFLKNGIFQKPYILEMANINRANRYVPSFSYSRFDQYQMSTSGIYLGSRFVDAVEGEIIRSHIINPVTGYPAQQTHHLANVISTTLSGLELDYITTSLIVLGREEGITFLKSQFSDEDVNVMYLGVDSQGYYAAFNRAYLTGNELKFKLNSGYREIILENF